MQGTFMFKSILVELLGILIREKEALIKNDNDLIITIVEKKIQLIDSIIQLDKNQIEESEEISAIIEEIKEIQGTNFILTKQALKYQENLIEVVAKNMASIGNVYSEEGKYKNTNQSMNIIDQTI